MPFPVASPLLYSTCIWPPGGLSSLELLLRLKLLYWQHSPSASLLSFLLLFIYFSPRRGLCFATSCPSSRKTAPLAFVNSSSSMAITGERDLGLVWEGGYGGEETQRLLRSNSRKYCTSKTANNNMKISRRTEYWLDYVYIYILPGSFP